MSDCLRTLTDKQHVELIIHRFSVKLLRTAKNCIREALNFHRFTQSVAVFFRPQLELIGFEPAPLRFETRQTAQRQLIFHNQQVDCFAEFVES